MAAAADILNWLTQTELPHTVVPVAAICALLGAAVLWPFTRQMGLWTLPVSFAVLFVGAYAANLLTNRFELPFNRFVERPLLMSVFGMMVIAIPLLFVLQRRPNE
mgnify:CR=1 FL=1